MQVLWQCGDWISVIDIQKRLANEGKGLALPSIRTMLGILQEKEAVIREGEGRRHLYRAVMTEEATQSGMLGEILEKAFHNNAGSLVAALLRVENISESDLERARLLLNQHSARQREEES